MIDHLITITYKLQIDEETGEILNTEIVKKVEKDISQSKISVGEAQAILDSNKLTFNQAAVSLMKAKPGDKIVIKYEDTSKDICPIVGTSDAFGVSSGNKLTKSFTISCRGSSNDELSNYGTVFILTPYKNGLFIMKSNDKEEEPKQEDLDLSVFSDDLGITCLNNEKIITEIESDFFKNL